MKTKNKLLCVLISLCLCSLASAASPSWIYGQSGPGAWTINPGNPDHTDTISYSGPLGTTAYYGNSCFARANLGGTPMISINSTNKIVELWFQGPAPTQCTMEWHPVCGLEGTFGPLAPGNWTFRCTETSMSFEIQFTVGGTSTGATYYVDKDAPGPFHNGSSWKWAFTNLQDALDVATTGNMILIAEGTYYPDQGNSVTPGDREASFEITSEIGLIGSYAGYGNINPNERDTEIYTTILSGDLNNNDIWGPLYTTDNSYRVVSITDCPSCSALLDGLVIAGGQADGSAPCNSGGGVYIDGTNPILINCTISGNTAVFGGGISSNNGSSPTLLNCKITGNNALVSGGGLYCYSNNFTLTNCLIAGNNSYQAEYIGSSAILNLNASLTITNCTIMDNIAPNGMAITSLTWESMPTNYLSVNNSILYNGGNEIFTNHTGTTYVYYTDIQGGWSGTGGSNINQNPLVVALGAWNTNGIYTEGDFHLQSASPCIDQGSDSLLPNDVGDLDEDGITSDQLPVDLDGADRVLGTQVDMGAYESTETSTPDLPDPSWQHIYTVHVTHTKVQDNPSATLSNSFMITLPIPVQGNIKLYMEPASPAGGNWNAWLNPDPGVVGPGSVTMTINIQGTDVDLTQFPSGSNQLIAYLKIYVQPS